MKLYQQGKSYRFFEKVISFRNAIIIITLIITAGLASFIPGIRIDTSVEAFIQPDHPSLVSRDKLKEVFGLSDPVILAIENNGPDGIYNPASLKLIRDLTDTIQIMEGVAPERVISLSTENSISGDSYGLLVDPFLEDLNDGANIRRRISDFPMYVGNLVSEDGTVSLIIVELVDKQKYGAKVYNSLVNLTTGIKGDDKLYVAGEGAVVEHLGKYVQDDAKLMTPLAFLVITIILFLAYRTLGGLLLSNMLVVGSLLIAMGVMVAMDVPFYLISNIIPVIIIAISVADSIHILGHFYQLKAERPDLGQKELTIITMTEMWRPIIITSVTNIVGFIAMGYSSNMPPMRAVGLFSSIGVMSALLFALFVLPSVMSKVDLMASKAFARRRSEVSVDGFGRVMLTIGNAVLRKPVVTVILSIVIVIAGVIGMTRMELNDTMVEYFNHNEEIYQADKMMNTKMDGTNFFDIMIETDQSEGLFAVERLKRIEALQRFVESQPHVKGTTSIVDILKQLNRSVNNGHDTEYRLPEDDDLIAQYFLLYSTSSSPTDFERYVDNDYRLANIRVMMDNGQYKAIRPVINSAKEYLDSEFNTGGMTGEVSGWLNVVNYWIGNIRYSHFLGVILALIIVTLISAISFRSLTAGLLAMIPVLVAVFLNYAIMGFTGIWLKVSTSITVAIAIGVAVDFAVHTIDRLIVLVHDKGMTIDEALPNLYPNTGRALLFNLMALALGFGTNMVSSVPPWATFGLLVMTMVSVSFIASLTLLPVLIKVIKPDFLRHRQATIKDERIVIDRAA